MTQHFPAARRSPHLAAAKGKGKRRRRRRRTWKRREGKKSYGAVGAVKTMPHRDEIEHASKSGAQVTPERTLTEGIACPGGNAVHHMVSANKATVRQELHRGAKPARTLPTRAPRNQYQALSRLSSAVTSEAGSPLAGVASKLAVSGRQG